MPAPRPREGVVPGLRGDNLPLDARQHQLRFGQGQTQIGDVDEAIGPANLHDVRARPLAFRPDFHQPQNPSHVSTLGQRTSAEYPTAVAPPISRRSPKRPVVCFDESPTQLIGEARQPIPAAPGQLERYDYEYRRNGTVNLFVFLDAHRPWRRVKVTAQRTARDFAECMRELVDLHYPQAQQVRVVLDNLSTHSAGALYAAKLRGARTIMVENDGGAGRFVRALARRSC